MLSSSLTSTTYPNCDSGMREFTASCHLEDIYPLQATTQSIVRYTAWLGLQGTVAATSLQQYYSAINKLFRDHQQQPIAVCELLADARRGLEMQQECLHAADSRLPFPTPLALSLLSAAADPRTHLTWTPPSRHMIAQFRALLAVCPLCPDKFGFSSEKLKATSDAARPINQSWLYQPPSTRPSRTSGMVLRAACHQLRKILQQPPTTRTMELRT
jgi:hypothetical protein